MLLKEQQKQFTQKKEENKLKKIYGRFTVEIFDDDGALGLKDTVSINENTPERYKKAVKTILTTLSEEYPYW